MSNLPAEETALAPRPECRAPEINRLIPAYCFGRAGEAERPRVEAHLRECAVCHRAAARLRAAADELEADRSLLATLDPAEAAAALGVSGRFADFLGGHSRFVLAAGVAYGLMCAVAVVLEAAYQFDRYGRVALAGAGLVGAWTAATLPAALWLDRRRVRRRGGGALALTSAAFVGSAGAAFALACFFLPPWPVVEANFRTYTAQGAFLKALVWIGPLVLLFLVLPFHFVVTLQRELQAGRHAGVLALLAAAALGVVPGASHLFDNLRPSPFESLYTVLYFTRWGLYFALGLASLLWYQRLLNELKRECLLALGPPRQ